MDELKEKYIQFCCDFYNEHAPEDKIWFGRMFDDCHQEHNKRNSSMYRWQFPLKVLKDQQAIIDDLKSQLNNMEACYIEKKKRVDKLESALNEVKEWKSHPEGYEASFGSWGVRDFYKDLAGKALRGESCQ